MGAELPTDGPFARLGQAKESSLPGNLRQTRDQKALHSSENDKQGFQKQQEQSSRYAVETESLDFSYPGIDGRPLPGVPPVVKNMTVHIPKGSRVLLIGPNGAGKTTMLKVLGGKHMVARDSVKVLGGQPFHDTALTSSGDLSYLGGNWERDIAFAGYSIPLQGDFSVAKMVNGLPNVDHRRKAKLLDVLDIDLDWRMHLVSDGQRRRVQLLMGLLRPFKVLLLDEITVDLDVLGRADLLQYLNDETEQRGATIIYATHIFDGLESWPTHIMYLANGELKRFQPSSSFPELEKGHLLELVERWLRVEAKEKARVQKSIASFQDEQSEKPNMAEWNNGYASGRMTSSLKDSSNAVMRM